MSIKNFLHNGKYSQQGEQGIIDEALKRIKPKLRTCVEFGGADGYYCSNTAHLRDAGWNSFMYDFEDVKGLVEKKEITIYNVNDLPACSVLSIDCDSIDLLLWEAYKGKPDIVIIEINSSLDPDVDFYTPETGANFSIMNALAETKGYFLLVHTGNCVYILNKHLDMFKDRDETFNTSWL